MKKSFTEQLLLAKNVDYVRRPIEPANIPQKPAQQPPLGQLPQAAPKPMGANVAQKFATAMTPAQQSPEQSISQANMPSQDQQMSFLERMRINSKLRGSGNGANT